MSPGHLIATVALWGGCAGLGAASYRFVQWLLTGEPRAAYLARWALGASAMEFGVVALATFGGWA